MPEHSLLAALERACEDSDFPQPPAAVTQDASALCREDILFYCDQLDRLEARLSLQASCGAGCGHCCRQLICLTEGELVPLGQALAALDSELRQRIRTRCAVICHTLAEYGLETDGTIHSGEAYERLLAQYDRLYLFCPLLDEQKRCLVYPVRPGVCWSYRSYAEPSLCAQPRGSSGCICFESLAEAASDRLAAALGTARSPLYILPFAVLRLLSRQASEEGGPPHATTEPDVI